MPLLEVGQVVKPHGLRGEVRRPLRLEPPRAPRVGPPRTEACRHERRRPPGDRARDRRRSVPQGDRTPRPSSPASTTSTPPSALRGVVLFAEPIEDAEALFVHDLIGCRGRSTSPARRTAPSPASRRTRRATCSSSTDGPTCRGLRRRAPRRAHRRRRARGARSSERPAAQLPALEIDLLHDLPRGRRGLPARRASSGARQRDGLVDVRVHDLRAGAVDAAPQQSTTPPSAAEPGWCSRPSRSSAPSKPSSRSDRSIC